MRAARSAALACMLLASACGGAWRMSAPLVQVHWKLVALDGRPFQSSSEHGPYLVFETNEQRVRGSGGCNRLTGTYRQEGDDLTIGPLAATKMACPDLAAESAFLAALERVRHVAIAGRNLTLSDADGRPVAQFLETPGRK
jgi:heat shock protein HslJ